ncbi:MAG: sulfatase-like hydrolase/transferase [Saprospiraceae bacterium]
MKQFILYILVLLTGFSSCQNATPKPNIILIMTDDQGWFDAGFNGNATIQTPWLDTLASQGIVFNRFYSASAVCSPTRASVITGRNPLRMNIPNANTGHMLEQEITLPEILQEAGYATGHFGKWHLGTLTRTQMDANRGGRDKFLEHYSVPTEHGYDEYFCTESKVPTYDPMLKPKQFKTGESLRYGWRAVEKGDTTLPFGTAYWTGDNQQVLDNLEGDNSRIIMDRAIPFIEKAQQNEQPFFSSIWLHTPHLPVVSDSLHRGNFSDLSIEKQLYYGTIAAMDEQIGRLWKHLQANDLADNTIIFFCSDNGPERGTPGDAGIFKARKRSLYEGGVRVPAFVVWPNRLEAGKRIDFPAVTSDYLPTVLDWLNLSTPNQRPLDGVNLAKALDGKQGQRVKPIGFIYQNQITWVTQQYKLKADKKLENFELYDLLQDPSEAMNVIADYPEVTEQLKAGLLQWLESVDQSSQGLDY